MLSVLRRLRPVRGWFAWELQAGPLVIQWPHAQRTRLLVWRDPYWR